MLVLTYVMLNTTTSQEKVIENLSTSFSVAVYATSVETYQVLKSENKLKIHNMYRIKNRRNFLTKVFRSIEIQIK